mmetsp:Transcript_140472/g.436779  ORF Transcript_140472/g.436779 Transcript_140472/m.436779 type:complete len:338 (+) Transcript_140472:1055-2068(+)
MRPRTMRFSSRMQRRRKIRTRRVSRVSRMIRRRESGAILAEVVMASRAMSPIDTATMIVSKRFHQRSEPLTNLMGVVLQTRIRISRIMKMVKAKFPQNQASPSCRLLSLVCRPMKMPFSTMRRPTAGSILVTTSALGGGPATSSSCTCVKCATRRFALPLMRTSRIVSDISQKSRPSRFRSSSSRMASAKILKRKPWNSNSASGSLSELRVELRGRLRKRNTGRLPALVSRRGSSQSSFSLRKRCVMSSSEYLRRPSLVTAECRSTGETRPLKFFLPRRSCIRTTACRKTMFICGSHDSSEFSESREWARRRWNSSSSTRGTGLEVSSSVAGGASPS